MPNLIINKKKILLRTEISTKKIYKYKSNKKIYNYAPSLINKYKSNKLFNE